MKKIIIFTAALAMLLTACNIENGGEIQETGEIGLTTNVTPVQQTVVFVTETVEETSATEPVQYKEISGEKQVEFCYNFTIDLQLMQTIVDMTEIVPLNEEAYDGTLAAFVAWTQHNGAKSGSEEDFYRVLEETLGITDYDLNNSPLYREMGKELLTATAQGGIELFYQAGGVYEDSAGNCYADINYYTDAGKGTIARTVRYYMEKNGSSYKMTSTEIIYDSNLPVGIITY